MLYSRVPAYRVALEERSWWHTTVENKDSKWVRRVFAYWVIMALQIKASNNREFELSPTVVSRCCREKSGQVVGSKGSVHNP